jgi:hypothetical protein
VGGAGKQNSNDRVRMQLMHWRLQKTALLEGSELVYLKSAKAGPVD